MFDTSTTIDVSNIECLVYKLLEKGQKYEGSDELEPSHGHCMLG